jgi:hypothetical protein
MELNAILFILCFSILFSLFSSIHSLHLVYAASAGGGEEEEEQKQEKASSKIDPFDIAANTYGYFIRQLENFEFTVNLDTNKIFPNDEIKQDIVSKYKSADYNIANLKYELLGFNISASDIKIHVDPTKIDLTKTRIDIPVMLANNVKVSNGVVNLAFNKIDLGSIYAIYERNPDKMTIHVPMSIAYRYLQQ